MISIIADDLTGACDTAVKLCGKGRSIKVLMNWDTTKDMQIEQSHVVAFTTNTRSLQGMAAYDTVKKLVDSLKKYEWEMIYKKVDSLLRGNVAYELKAIMDSMNYSMAIVAPAIPDNGRLVIHGQIISSLETSQGVDVLSCFGEPEEMKPAIVPIETVRSGVDAVTKKLVELRDSGVRVAIIDSTDEISLETVAKAVSALPFRALLSGASGWIQHLVKEVPSDPILKQADWRQIAGDKKYKTLIVAGTSHEVTKRQIQNLLGMSGTSCIKIDVNACIRGDGAQEVSRCMEEVELAMRDQPDTLLLAVNSLFQIPKETGVKYNEEISVSSIVETVATLTRMVLTKYKYDTLFVTGGETAYQVLEKMQVDQIDILNEFVPGVPVNLVHNKDHDVLLVTKSGGFGDTATITEFVEFIKAM